MELTQLGQMWGLVFLKGSLLGPILFLLFENDMPRVVQNASLAMFADDSKCFKVIYQESDFVNLQRDLDALSTWAVSNELFFQPTKCVNLRISKKRNSPSRNYSLNGISLEVVKAEKDLGVLNSSDMTWKDHINMVVAKANKMLGFLKRNCAGLVNRDFETLSFFSALACLFLLAGLGSAVNRKYSFSR